MCVLMRQIPEDMMWLRKLDELILDDNHIEVRLFLLMSSCCCRYSCGLIGGPM